MNQNINMKRCWKNNRFLIRTVLRNRPVYIFIMFVDSIMALMMPSVIAVYFTREFLGTVESLVFEGNADYTRLFPVFFLVIAWMLIRDLWRIFTDRVYVPYAGNKFSEKIMRQIYQKSISLDLSCYDNPDFYEQYTWSIQRGAGICLESINNIIYFIVNVITLVTISGIILTLDWFSMIIVVLYVAISFIFDWISKKINYNEAVQEQKLWRRIDYADRVFFLDKVAKELRLSKVADLILRRYNDDMLKAKKLETKFVSKNFGLWFLYSLFNGGLWDIAFTLALVSRIVIYKTLTISGMVTIQTAAGTVSSKVYALLRNIARVREIGLLSDAYIEFLNRPTGIKQNTDANPLDEHFSSLELKNVSFRYPGSEVYAVKNLSMKINKNEKIAIVGYNGAGKSTLIKLLMRLYQQEDGRLIINGHDVEDVTLESYRKKFGSVFQDIHLFSLSIAENVLMDHYDESKRQDVLTALKKAHFDKVDTLPKGIHSMITREFDEEGVLLSGGEQQKIAIARTFANDYDFIIMDEPSAALDPDSEYELNKLMMTSAFNKTVIFISHRLSTTRMADRIYMMEKGEIIEYGTHDELLKLNGKYAEMFNLQAKNYRNVDVKSI